MKISDLIREIKEQDDRIYVEETDLNFEVFVKHNGIESNIGLISKNNDDWIGLLFYDIRIKQMINAVYRVLEDN